MTEINLAVSLNACSVGIRFFLMSSRKKRKKLKIRRRPQLLGKKRGQDIEDIAIRSGALLFIYSIYSYEGPFLFPQFTITILLYINILPW